MNLDPQMFAFMQEVRGALSRLEVGQENFSKIAAQFEAHVASEDAHGGKARWSFIRDSILVIGFVLSAYAVLRGNPVESKDRQVYIHAK